MQFPDTHSHAARRRGFVLIELVVVLVLIAIITAMVVPMYGASMVDIQRNSTRNQRLGILSHIQERAVSESAQYRFYLRADTGEYWVEKETGELSADYLPIFAPIGETYGQLAKLPIDYSFVDVRNLAQDRIRDANFIRCFPNGASDKVTFAVHDARKDGKAFTISVLGALGQVRAETPDA